MKVLVVLCLVVLGFFTSGVAASEGGLKYSYYYQTCPQAEAIIASTMKHISSKDITVLSRLIRMHFHDCIVRGCDGSVLINSTKGNKAEKDEALNNPSLQGFEAIDQIKEVLEGICADILTYAARESVYLSGKFKYYDVRGGCKDGKISKASEATLILPPSSDDAKSLIKLFESKGLSLKDMVTLSDCKQLVESTPSIDRKSSLPHDILYHILSFIDTETLSMVRTCVLSRNWVNLWKFVPNLSFTERKGKLKWWKRYVKQVLANSDIKTFSFTTILLSRALLRTSIRFAITHKVQHLYLKAEYNWGNTWELPACIIGVTLRELVIEFQGFSRLPIVKLPVGAFLPQPDILYLKNVEITDAMINDFVSSSCPLLKEFSLVECRDLKHLCITSESLEKLSVDVESKSLESLSLDSCFF